MLDTHIYQSAIYFIAPMHRNNYYDVSDTNMYTHMHTRMHARIHACTHACTHTHLSSYYTYNIQCHTYVCILYMYTCMNISTYTGILCGAYELSPGLPPHISDLTFAYPKS